MRPRCWESHLWARLHPMNPMARTSETRAVLKPAPGVKKNERPVETVESALLEYLGIYHGFGDDGHPPSCEDKKRGEPLDVRCLILGRMSPWHLPCCGRLWPKAIHGCVQRLVPLGAIWRVSEYRRRGLQMSAMLGN